MPDIPSRSDTIQADAQVTISEACCESCGDATTASPNEQWLALARYARWLAWASLAWMTAEGGVGLAAGIAAGSVALTGWALGSAIEGMASVIVVWRFTGSRTLSVTAERRAQKAVAISFWLLAPTSPSTPSVTLQATTLRACHWRGLSLPRPRSSSCRSSARPNDGSGSG